MFKGSWAISVHGYVDVWFRAGVVMPIEIEAAIQ